MSKVDKIDEIIKYLTPEEIAEIDAINAELPIWVPLPGPQTEAYYCEADELFYGGAGGGGKCLDINTPIPTSDGWKTMGNIGCGDTIFDSFGCVSRVLATSRILTGHTCYKLTFSDGSELIADSDHKWKTFTIKDRAAILRLSDKWREKRRKRRPSRATGKNIRPHVAINNSKREYSYLSIPSGNIYTTKEIKDSLTIKGRTNHSIKVSSPLILPEKNLPISAYVLGLWLGDGSSYKAEITTADQEIINALTFSGYKIKHRDKYTYGVNGGLLTQLKSENLLKNKHIPQKYLRGSVPQRISLLQGLMDTDGTCDKRGQCSFTTTKVSLKNGMLELLSSLGIKAAASEGRAKLYGKDCGPVWDIKFLTELPAFRLPRKLNKQKRAGFRGTHNQRYIIDCQQVPSVPVKCLKTSSPTNLYLAGTSMIPTHNTDLLLGCALTQHYHSIIFRRQSTQLLGIQNRLLDEILHSRKNWNGQDDILRQPDGRIIEFGSCNNAGEEQKYQGRPHSLKGFDEITHFLESQYVFLCGWKRTTTIGERQRIICCGNPPMDADGEWVIRRWAPWLDKNDPNPAQPGELRWYAMIDGVDTPREDGTPFEHKGDTITPQSRTFIPSHVEDNPFLMATGYKATLQALPEPLRSQMLKGDFTAGKDDNIWQVIPTSWVEQAMARWKPEGKKGQMDSLGADVARGGQDKTQLAPRYGSWYDQLKSFPGSDTPNGQIVAGLIISVVRDAAPIHIDIAGVGGSPYDFLNENSVQVVGINNAETDRSKDQTDKASGQLKFRNNRAFLMWRFREALEPEKGENLALPPDSELKADLCAPRWKLTASGVQIESKEEVKKRIGRSPDKGDAVILASINTVKIKAQHKKDFRKPGGTWRSR